MVMLLVMISDDIPDVSHKVGGDDIGDVIILMMILVVIVIILVVRAIRCVVINNDIGDDVIIMIIMYSNFILVRDWLKRNDNLPYQQDDALS